MPKFLKLKIKEGKHVPLVDRAPTIAEYLETEHWTNPMDGIQGISQDKVIAEELGYNKEKI